MSAATSFSKSLIIAHKLIGGFEKRIITAHWHCQMGFFGVGRVDLKDGSRDAIVTIHTEPRLNVF